MIHRKLLPTLTAVLAVGLALSAPAPASATTLEKAAFSVTEGVATEAFETEGPCLDRAAAYVEANAEAEQVHYTACVDDTATVSVPDGERGATIVASEYSASNPEEKASLDGTEPAVASRANDMSGSCTIMDTYEVDCEWKIAYAKWQGTTLVWTRSITVDADLFLQINSHEVKLRFNHDQGKTFSLSGDVTTMNMQGWLSPTEDSSLSYAVYGGLGTASTTRWTERLNLEAAKPRSTDGPGAAGSRVNGVG